MNHWEKCFSSLICQPNDMNLLKNIKPYWWKTKTSPTIYLLLKHRLTESEKWACSVFFVFFLSLPSLFNRFLIDSLLHKILILRNYVFCTFISIKLQGLQFFLFLFFPVNSYNYVKANYGDSALSSSRLLSHHWNPGKQLEFFISVKTK